MVTVEQAKQYLASQGIEIPDIVVEVLVEQANSVEPCLAANYSPSTAMLIQLYLICLMGLAQGGRYITSQRGPSGASRSFQYKDSAEMWKGVTGLLRQLDKSGCTDSLIPSDPTIKSFAGIWIAKGSCKGECNE